MRANSLTVLGMVTRISVAVYREAQRQILIIVAEFGHGHLASLPPGRCVLKFVLGLQNTHEVFLVGLTCAFNHQVRVIIAKTQEFGRFKFARNLELNHV